MYLKNNGIWLISNDYLKLEDIKKIWQKKEDQQNT